MSDAYSARQDQRDYEYKEAWKKAPPAFLRQAEDAGLKASTERPGRAVEHEENYTTTSYTPDMSALIDTYTDELIEKHGGSHEIIIRSIIQDLQAPMEREIERNRAMTLGRVVCYLVQGENKNILASIHGLLHAIPRLAEANGFGSMRASARACKVSPEWAKRCRDKWCDILGIPVPEEGTKSEAAKAKYAEPKGGHWRTRKFSSAAQP